MSSKNTVVIYASHPEEYPVKDIDLKIEKREFNLDSIKLDDGAIITKNLYLSVDPYLRDKMRPGGSSYAGKFEIGKPVFNFGVGRVLKSSNSSFEEGQIVYTSALNWEEYSVISGDLLKHLSIVENPHNLPLSNFVGGLGMPGQTAYVGLYEIGKPKTGETIFISAASGAVGQLVGQLAKVEGLHVVGSAGDDEKVEFLKKVVKFDAAFNYKKVDNLKNAIAEHCPKGIDIYFENVGGETLEAVLPLMNKWGRIIGCGMISQYNAKNERGVKGLMNIIGKSLTFRGFLVNDYFSNYKVEFFEKVSKWIKEKKIVYKEDITEGIENMPDAFIGMLKGKNFGKALVKVHKDE